jgi:translation initiation factor IF-3
LVLERHCRRAIAFEGRCMARQHEVVIQLLERAVTTVTDVALCATTPGSQSWRSQLAGR